MVNNRRNCRKARSLQFSNRKIGKIRSDEANSDCWILFNCLKKL
jgi:hypothetical protein